MTHLGAVVRAVVGGVALGFFGFAAGAEVHEIGTVGASFESGAWERQRVSDSIGKDQFRRVGADHYFVVLELFALFEQREDFVGQLGLLMTNIESQLSEPEVEPEMLYERSEGLTRATRRATGSHSGVELFYQLDLISAGDGVGYLLMSWTGVTRRQEAIAALDEVVEAFRLPDEGSEWHGRTLPTKQEFRFGEWIVELSLRPSVFTPDVDSVPGQRYSFAGDGGDLALHLFVDELAGGADQVLDNVVSVVSEDDTYEELLRSDLEIDGLTGRQILVRSQGDPPHDLAVAVLGLGEERWVDLRMVTSGPTGHRDALWNGILGSLRVAREARVDAFPIVEPTPPIAAESLLTEPGRRLLDASRLLARVPWTRAVVAAEGGSLVSVDSDGVRRIVPAAEGDAPAAVELLAGGERLRGLPVALEDAVLVHGAEEIRRVVEGRVESAGFRAERMAARGERLLLARGPEPVRLTGIGSLPAAGPIKVLLREPSGAEREVAELPGGNVVALALGEHRALVASNEPGDLVDPGETPVTLLEIELESGAARERGRWRKVDRVVAAPGGWLVSGEPGAGVGGIYRLGADGPAALLVSGPVLGLALDERELVFVADVCLDASQAEMAPCAYRATLADVAEHGSGYWPLGGRLLSRVAAEVFGRARTEAGRAPQSREEVAALVAAASEATRAETGWPLPAGAGGADLLVSRLAWDHEIDEGGVALLAVVLAEALLGEGASWVAAADPMPERPEWNGWQVENALAVGIAPSGVVRSTLFSEEGWYRPIQGIRERAEGRELAVGFDPESLTAAVRDALPGELARRIEAGDAGPLRDLLAAHPRNTYLRATVYRRLAAAGRRETLLELAGRFASGENAAPIDRLFEASVRLAGGPSAAEAEELIEGLRAAIGSAPEDAGLYLLLGSAYERSARDERASFARACYRKAADLVQWGPVAEAATAALAGLDTADD